MKRRAFVNGILPSLLSAPALAAEPLPALQETPMFADRVRAGALPPVARRIPEQPLLVRTFAGDDGPGRQGGQLTTMVAGPPDMMLMMVYSYTRLIVYDSGFCSAGSARHRGQDYSFKPRPG